MSNSLPDWLNPEPWLNLEFTAADVWKAIHADSPDETTLTALLSPAAAEFLEPMAQRAQAITRRHFGRTIALYAPLYLSNFCNAGCTYCGFAADRRARRGVLSAEDLHREMAAFSAKGLQEIVLLTGDRVPQADVSYLSESIRIAADYVSSVNIEVFPMETREYAQLARAGCRGVTLYQETYDEERYLEVHRWGRKRNFYGRLTAPDRALSGGMRHIGIGALLGLSDPRFDMLAVYRHANYLRKRYWQAGISVSFPRIRPQLGGFRSTHAMTDRMLAQYIFAFRICMADVPLVLSTREPVAIRDGLAGVGISKMSIESRTTVGGYSEETEETTEQFEISDERSLPDFCSMLRQKGLEPVFKDWDATYREPAHYQLASA